MPTRKDLDRIDRKGLVVLAVDLNDSHIVSVNRKDVVRIAGDGHNPKAVPKVVI
jgi:hypothetical protein